ncbi:MAG: prephenate dehydratase domain-containing protein, partial [Vicinamibacteria bacterium]
MSDAHRKPESATLPIQEIRRDIDALDHELLRLLGERRRKSMEAAKAKEVEPDWFRDRAREEQLLSDRIRVGRGLGLDTHFVATMFEEILEDSLRVQLEYYQDRDDNENARSLLVAYQGIEGSYSHLAAEKHLARRTGAISYLSCHQFQEVVVAVEKGTADVGVLPIENTTSGAINEVYDLLLHAQLSIVGEVKLKVDHCLLGLPQSRLSEIKVIYCHPQTVLQCSHFLARMPHAKIEYFSDTALSGRRIRDDANPSQAAIASEEAARLFGLSIIERGIANQEENYTRFLIAARKLVSVDGRIPCKTSIVMMTGNQPGSLLEALMVFRDHRINLTKLESRPVLQNPWEEMFYVDFEGNLESEHVRRAIDEVTRKARFIKVLGCYPSQDLPLA